MVSELKPCPFCGSPATTKITVVLLSLGQITVASLSFEELTDGGVAPYWSVPFEHGDFLKAIPGDRWAYLPTPPEASE